MYKMKGDKVMNNIHPKLEQLLKSMVKIMNSNFQFQTSLAKLVIDSCPNLSELQKTQFVSILESLSTAHILLSRQSDEILPS